MKILVACEESQAVTIELRKLGHEAYSCDIIPCSGGHPEWHLQQYVTPLLKEHWDMIIAFPPCTHLCSSGQWAYSKGFKDVRKREEGVAFFMQFANANCERIAIKNPVGIMSTRYRKPDQIIQPWMFGHPASKTTCLWLKGLPKLKPEVNQQPELEYFVYPNGKRMQKWMYDIRCISDRKKRAAMASKTFPGIARAMAEQWAGKAEEEHD